MISTFLSDEFCWCCILPCKLFYNGDGYATLRVFNKKSFQPMLNSNQSQINSCINPIIFVKHHLQCTALNCIFRSDAFTTSLYRYQIHANPFWSFRSCHISCNVCRVWQESTQFAQNGDSKLLLRSGIHRYTIRCNFLSLIRLLIMPVTVKKCFCNATGSITCVKWVANDF